MDLLQRPAPIMQFDCEPIEQLRVSRSFSLRAKILFAGYQPGAPCPAFDVQAANTLLEQHGWVKGPDGVRVKGGARLEFQYSTTAGTGWREDDELILQQDFRAIGVKIDIQNYPASTLLGTFLTDAKPGVYDIVEYETGVGIDPDDASLLQCHNPGNTTYYCNPELDKLYKQQL